MLPTVDSSPEIVPSARQLTELDVTVRTGVAPAVGPRLGGTLGRLSLGDH